MNKFDVNVLCIKSEKLFENGKWDGLQTENLEEYYSLLLKHSEFRRRGDLEEDISYKQIIPQVILKYKNTYFLHYQDSSTDTRIEKMCPLPLGGHVDEFDIEGDKDVIQTALERELAEEANIKSKIIRKQMLGLIYIEDENPINHVHVGLVYIFELDGTDVEMNEKQLTKIGFVDTGYLKNHTKELTYWSNTILDSGVL